MKRQWLNGITLRLPFMGAVSTMVTEGDWRGEGAERRALFTRYQEEGDTSVEYAIGWLHIVRDPAVREADHTFVVKALGCAIALRSIILAMMS